MTNKEIGTLFEREACDILVQRGFWVHFLSPNRSGAQPFDVIAVKDGFAVAIDCKTCKDTVFRLSRLEVNQMMAFEKWIACGNISPVVLVKHNESIYLVTYTEIMEKGKVNLDENHRWK